MTQFSPKLNKLEMSSVSTITQNFKTLRPVLDGLSQDGGARNEPRVCIYLTRYRYLVSLYRRYWVYRIFSFTLNIFKEFMALFTPLNPTQWDPLLHFVSKIEDIPSQVGVGKVPAGMAHRSQCSPSCFSRTSLSYPWRQPPMLSCVCVCVSGQSRG